MYFMKTSELIFIGIKGSVIALDRAAGQQVWATHLTGSDFVNVVLEDGALFASCSGEVFCWSRSMAIYCGTTSSKALAGDWPQSPPKIIREAAQLCWRQDASKMP